MEIFYYIIKRENGTLLPTIRLVRESLEDFMINFDITSEDEILEVSEEEYNTVRKICKAFRKKAN